ncbi:hypothetical protein NC651_032907 [Populus alba x Populus x berolinensis]|nr:hypothetical protein NC651_032907 [Populus alba x Populus x berolinensis]
MTSTLSRLSYARVLIELDLSEDTPQSIEISLPSGQVLHKKVVYESLPKFCNFCKAIGHTRLLYSKAATSIKSGDCAQTNQTSKGGVFSRLSMQIQKPAKVTTKEPQDQSQSLSVQTHMTAPNSPIVISQPAEANIDPDEGWITVEPRQKSTKQVQQPYKGYIVNPNEKMSGKSLCPAPTIPTCSNVTNTPPSSGIVTTHVSAEVVAPACADIVTPICSDALIGAPIPGEGILASRPFVIPLLGNSVRNNGKHNNKRTSLGSRRVIPSPASMIIYSWNVRS